jgi:two-component system chemotaxis response regulator CheB
MTTPLIRVLLIDDSAVVRGAMRQIIDAAEDMQVVATASNGRLGLEELSRTPVDVVLLDIEMPELDGLATLPRILASHPKLRVIMASSLTQAGARVTMDALALGAADYITKPTARAGPAALASLANEIVEKIRAIGGAGRRRTVVRPIRTPVAVPVRPAQSAAIRPFVTPRVLAIASSTGGPNALASVLRALPASFALPIVITQHMPPLFTTLLAQRLQRESGRKCVEATNGEPLLPGNAYVAPGDFHMLIEVTDGAPYLRLTQTAPESHCRPAADPMLRSTAQTFGPAVLAVVLTGMGEDGRRGCEDVRRSGGRVLVQDEATSVVWGMPGAVANAGLADWTVPLNDIGARISAVCRGAA